MDGGSIFLLILSLTFGSVVVSMFVGEDFPLLGPLGAGLKRMMGGKETGKGDAREGDLLMQSAQQAYISKDYERAATQFISAASVYRTSGNRNLQAQSTIKAAEILSRMGQKTEAQDMLDEAELIYRETNHAGGLALLNRIYAEHDSRHGASEEALGKFNESARFSQLANDKLGMALSFKGLGDLFIKKKNFEKARENYDKSLPLLQEVGANQECSEMLLALGTLEYRLENRAKARACLTQATGLCRQLNNMLGFANAEYGIGTIDYENAQYNEALTHAGYAMPEYENLGNVLGVARCLLVMGEAYEKLNNYAKASEYYQKSMVTFRGSSNHAEEARCTMGIARVAANNGEFETARNAFNVAITLHKAASNAKGEGEALVGLGNVLADNLDADGAKEQANIALELYQRIGQRSGIGDVNLIFGRYHFLKKEYDLSSDFYNKAIDNFKISNEQYGEAQANYHKAILLLKKKDLFNARSAIETSLNLFRNINNKFGEALALIMLGESEIQERSFDKAYNATNNARGILTALEQKKHEGIAMLQLCIIAIEKNNLEEAQILIQNAMPSIHSSGNMRLVADAEIVQGSLYNSKGENDKAIVSFNQALNIYTNLADEEKIAEIYLKINALDGGDPRSSLEHLRNALEIYKKNENHAGMAQTQMEIGKNQLKLKEYSNSRKSLNASLDIMDKNNIVTHTAEVQYYIGMVCMATSLSEEAYTAFAIAKDYAARGGYTQVESMALLQLSNLILDKDPAAAAEMLERVIAIKEKNATQNKEELGKIALNLGKATFLSGNPQNAIVALKKASAYIEAVNKPDLLAFAQKILGESYLAINEIELAEQNLKRAMASFRNFNKPLEEAEAMVGLAKIHLKNENNQKYKDMIDQAAMIYNNLGDAQKAREVQAGLI